MDVALFAEQLNRVLVGAGEAALLEEACALLRMHTQAGVRFGDAIHLLPENDDGPHSFTYQDLTLYQLKEPPDADTRLAASILHAVGVVATRHAATRAKAERDRRTEAVRGVINTLSFSELEAAIHICRALPGGEGRLVAGHIADKLGFTRSVVVNTLRKLESAGMVESRSMGMKGTYLRVKDPLLAEELQKL